MCEATRVGFTARPAWDDGLSILPGGDHDDRCAPSASVARIDGPRRRRRELRLDRSNERATDDVQGKVACVFVQIRNEIITRQIRRISVRNREVRESRKTANGVEMQPIVTASPRTADFGVAFQHDGLYSAAAERGRRRESRCAAAHDDNL